MIQRALRTHVTSAAVLATILFVGIQVKAQDDDESEPADTADAPPSEEAVPSDPADPEAPAADADAQAASKAELDSDVGVKLAASTEEEEAEAAIGDDEKATAKAGVARPYGKAEEWSVEPYGYVRFDAIRDSTQSFFDGQQPYLIARPGTYKGQHPRMILTARDSRVGLSLGAPKFHSIETSGRIEFDFFGLPPTDAKEHDQTVFGPVRIRHAYVKLENPVIDIVAGQTHDLFGWGSTFYPATVAFLGVPGQVYHRNPQLRLEKRLDFGGVELLTALAAVRPGQRDSGIPDGQAGLKLAVDGWSGASTQGFGRPGITPLSLGVSGLYRFFEAPVFRNEPGAESTEDTGYGVVFSALLPVIPAKKVEDRSNALTLTGEFSVGSGIADMYTGMDGGSRPPLLPNLSPLPQAYVYPQNFDPGLVTFDRAWELASINWQAFVAGIQYYLPIGGGDVWISGVYSQIKSDNIKELTPAPSWGGIFTKMEYIDANLGVAITPAVLVGFSFQTLKQTFADISPPTPVYGEISGPGVTAPIVPGTGGVRATARNNRGQFTMSFFF